MSDSIPKDENAIFDDRPGIVDDAVKLHDERVANSGLQLWMGAEPTFTKPQTELAEWRTAAIGFEKEGVARKFIQAFSRGLKGGVILRTLGRQYPGESKPRWNYGIYTRRDGSSLWNGPPDPIAIPTHDVAETTRSTSPGASPPDFSAEHSAGPIANPGLSLEFRNALEHALRAAGYHTNTDLPETAWGLRLLFSADNQLLQNDWNQNPHAVRPPLHSLPIPSGGWMDNLAASGIYLIAIGPCETSFQSDCGSLQIELPAFKDVEDWLRCLEILGTACRNVRLQSLVLSGFPPPINSEVAWTTITPDPGVLEINMAPCVSVYEFLTLQRQLYATAELLGLSPFQLFFNGETVDSGGGQHLTFGGPSPTASPFLVKPKLLPQLIVYLNRHPSLSYWFAVRAVGSCGQQPRPDEVSPESLDGLELALDRLFCQTSIGPELLWQSVAPFLCDRFGNSHRCEINVEKLWNIWNSERGRLGLVELRAFRMPQSPEDAAAVAVFMQTLIIRLSEKEDSEPLIEWGSRLHDQFALPFFLQQDLNEVVSDLNQAGYGLHNAVTSRLLNDSHIIIGECDLGNARLTVRQAIEFWPVVGDGSAHDQTFRLMDASTQRIELLLQPAKNKQDHDNGPTTSSCPWRLTIAGQDIPWVAESDQGSVVYVRGVRYKAFNPPMTVSPLVTAIDPLEFFLTSSDQSKTVRVQLYNWRPDGAPYDGQPATLEDARRRRKERLIAEPWHQPVSSIPIAQSMLSKYSVDLRKTVRPQD